MCKRKALWMLAVLCCLTAVGLTALHLHLPEQTGWVMAQSGAQPRQGESLNVDMPAGPVRVNTADEAELCELTGIGPSLAQAIIAERDLNGPFAYPEDLVAVKGIGTKTFLKLKDQLSMK